MSTNLFSARNITRNITRNSTRNILLQILAPKNSRTGRDDDQGDIC